MLIKKGDYLEELVQIWLQTNIKAHDFIPENYWNENVEFVKKALPEATIFCEGELPIKGFLGIVEGKIEGLFVRNEFQRMGVGTSLIEEAKQYFNTLSLCVYEKNKNAVAFYQKMGFVIKEQNIQQQTGKKEYVMIWTK